MKFMKLTFSLLIFVLVVPARGIGEKYLIQPYSLPLLEWGDRCEKISDQDDEDDPVVILCAFLYSLQETNKTSLEDTPFQFKLAHVALEKFLVSHLALADGETFNYVLYKLLETYRDQADTRHDIDAIFKYLLPEVADELQSDRERSAYFDFVQKTIIYSISILMTYRAGQMLTNRFWVKLLRRPSPSSLPMAGRQITRFPWFKQSMASAMAGTSMSGQEVASEMATVKKISPQLALTAVQTSWLCDLHWRLAEKTVNAQDARPLRDEVAELLHDSPNLTSIMETRETARKMQLEVDVPWPNLINELNRCPRVSGTLLLRQLDELSSYGLRAIDDQ